MECIKYERLTQKDLEQVIDLYDKERPVRTEKIKAKEAFENIMENPEYILLVAKIETEVIAFAKMEIHQDIFENCKPYMTVWSVRVKEKYRRKKVGTNLFKQVEKMAEEKGCEFFCLLAEKENKAANHFYKSLGYELVNGYLKSIERKK